MPRLSRLLALVAVLATAGCVSRADFERVRREQQEMRALLADTQVSVDKLSRRVDSVQSEAEDRGGSGATVKGLERRLARVESRIGAIEGAAPIAPVEGAPVSGETPATTTAAVPSPSTQAAVIALRREDARLQAGNVNETYRAALQAYREGQATKAIEQFRQFIRGAGTSDLTDNAQYWIGESYYNARDYNRAIIELNEVLLKYPQGDQVPGALLALATAFAESGDKIDARLILQKLITDHPKSEEAVVGRQQLQAMAE